MRLLADCGNSTLKLAAVGAHGPEDLRRLPSDPAAIAAALAGAEELSVVVAGRALLATLRACWAPRALRVVGQDLPLPAVGQYPTMGHDRILAGIAALADGEDGIVVDCGTATTLTAWRLIDGRPRTLGGMILPGATACAAGLHQLAPDLPLVAPGAADAAPTQLETPGAIAAALGLGYGAMVERCLERLRTATGIDRAIATGGAARRWLPDLPARQDLVLRGLWLVVERGGG